MKSVPILIVLDTSFTKVQNGVHMLSTSFDNRTHKSVNRRFPVNGLALDFEEELRVFVE